MVKVCMKILAIATLFSYASSLESYAEVESRVFFQIHPENQTPFNLSSNIGNAKKICPHDVPISWVVHGWTEGLYKTKWAPFVVSSSLGYAGGCVIFMDYSSFSSMPYADLVQRYYLLRDVLLNTINFFGNYVRMHVFGFSFGARLAIGVGNILTNANNGNAQIARMDLCEPAGPNFAPTDAGYAPANRGAMLVQVINTNSFGFGTGVYDGHINFKMGHCGLWQDGQGPAPMGSHGMCPYMYAYSFTYNFTYNERHKSECNYSYTKDRPIHVSCQHAMIMGRRNKIFCNGDVVIPTAICPPYVFTGTIYNYPKGKLTC